jgi:hypothetical protein
MKCLNYSANILCVHVCGFIVLELNMRLQTVVSFWMQITYDSDDSIAIVVLGDVMVILLAIGLKVRGFEPGQE